MSSSSTLATVASSSGSSTVPTPITTAASTNDLLPGVTPRPTRCTNPEVVLVISTTIVISNYNAYYRPTPVQSFQPTWRPLPDGSLITPPYEEDTLNSNIGLLVLGALGAIFVRNIFASADYLRRGKVKKKTLFYLLLASQLLAPISLGPVVVSHFWRDIQCNIVAILSYSGAMVSLGLLITGILGMKAYKCLENAPLVPIVLGILQAATSAVVIADLVETRTFRRLTGSCLQLVNLRYTRFFVGLQVVQALFVCFCFMYASYRSRRNPVARGRISLRMSMEDPEFELPPFVGEEGQQQVRQARGWWDYVPKPETAAARKKGSKSPTSWLGKFFPGFRNRMYQNTRTTPYPPTEEPKPSVVNLLDFEPQPAAPQTAPLNPFDDAYGRPYGRQSPAPSTTSRFSRLFPRMVLFRKVLNDELLYTTFITAACLVVAILVAISVNFKTCLSITSWIAINWAFISLLVVHSLGRVIHRHERDAWIQQSALRTRSLTRVPTRQSARPSRSTRTSYSTAPWRPSSSSRYRSLRERRYRGDPDETQPLDQERFSWQFGMIDPFQDPSNKSPPSTLPVRDLTDDRNSWKSHVTISSGRRHSLGNKRVSTTTSTFQMGIEQVSRER